MTPDSHGRTFAEGLPDAIYGPEAIQPREAEIDISGGRVWVSIPTTDGGPAIISIPKEVSG